MNTLKVILREMLKLEYLKTINTKNELALAKFFLYRFRVNNTKKV